MAQGISSFETKEDSVYYNINMVNNSLTSVRAQFSQSLSSNIVENSNDYYLSCIRFVLDGAGLPIFIFKNNTGAPMTVQYGYWITLSYGGFSYSYNLSFTNSNPFFPNGIYNYGKFIDIINAGFVSAFTSLGGLVILPVDSAAPYMIYNAPTQLVSLYADANYLETAMNQITIYFNNTLYDFFNNMREQIFGEGLANHKDYRLLVQDLYGSNSAPLDPSIPTGFYKMTQEYPSLFRWYDWSNIAFKSNLLGIRPEYSQGVNTSTTSLVSNQSAGSGIPFTSQITDFSIDLTPGDPSAWRGTLYYTPSAQYRLLDIVKQDTNQIDLSIYIVDKQGNEYPFLIVPESNATVKLIFVKKSLYKNYKSDGKK